jgi:transposase
MGGDRRSDVLEAHAPTILGWLEETPDLFLGEIVARLADEGVATSGSSVARLLARHGITRKKRLWLLPSRPARISPRPALSGRAG